MPSDSHQSASATFALVSAGDQILSATVYFDNMTFEDAIQILEHAQAYKVKLCLKRKPQITDTEPGIEADTIPVTMHLVCPDSLTCHLSAKTDISYFFGSLGGRALRS